MMRKIFTPLAFCIFISPASFGNNSKELYGSDAAQVFPDAHTVVYNDLATVPSLIMFSEGAGIKTENAFEKIRAVLKISAADRLIPISHQHDDLGFTHYRHQQFYNGVKVSGGQYIIHEKNGFVSAMNGLFLEGISMNTLPALSEGQALQKALNHIGASVYKWNVPSEEFWIKHVTHNPQATLYPKGELEIMAVNSDYKKRDLRLTWKFDVYAHEPMSRHYVYVDANTGEIIFKEDRICHVDVVGSANTMYSGTQPITTDSVNPTLYRLRETGRGQGIETYDLNNGTNYGNAVDFTDADNNWTTTTNYDDAATDAHWGAESTYDYFTQIHNRNGLDNNGMKMLSYVHYGNNYNNAFWNGQAMTYGDGSNASGGFRPLTAIDVCGHEFTHGVTNFSANLVYSYQSGALNESFSDIFGTAIEFWKKPSSANWLIGDQIVFNQPGALRNMMNPNQYNDPDTYLGTFWYTGTADNGGVHTNSGVQNKWFYILSIGESGTNDIGNNYNVTGIGIMNAARIAFRNLTTYLVTSSQYSDARTYAILSAQDLFGACSPEVIATTNAWYAVGVGGLFSASVTSSFTASVTTSCSVPFAVSFTNTSTNATNAVWDFGDNNTASTYNATHTYTNPGTYTVTLSVNSACGSNTTTQTSYISVNTPPAPTGTGNVSCGPGSMTLTASGSGNLEWFTQPVAGTSVGTGNSYTTPMLSATTTYYVENQVAQNPGNVGPVNNSFGTGGNHNSTTAQYLRFDVLQPCTLVSVWVNASTAGNRNITLWDNAGNVIQTMAVNIPTGQNTITLNLPLSPGTGYRLGGASMNLYRNNSGPTYPYTLSGLVNITGSSAGNAYYYYFYNWLIQPEPCKSPRTPVTATIGGTQVAFAPLAPVCDNQPAFALTGGSPSGGVYSGPGVGGGNFDPAQAGAGTHNIVYTFTDANGCQDSAMQTITVNVCAGMNELISGNSLVLMPNPSAGNLMVELFSNSALEADFSVFNGLGQKVWSMDMNLVKGSNRIPLSLNELPTGSYWLTVSYSGGTLSRKIALIK
jgi:Zn-dependent metalloprotease